MSSDSPLSIGRGRAQDLLFRSYSLSPAVTVEDLTRELKDLGPADAHEYLSHLLEKADGWLGQINARETVHRLRNEIAQSIAAPPSLLREISAVHLSTPDALVCVARNAFGEAIVDGEASLGLHPERLTFEVAKGEDRLVSVRLILSVPGRAQPATAVMVFETVGRWVVSRLRVPAKVKPWRGENLRSGLAGSFWARFTRLLRRR